MEAVAEFWVRSGLAYDVITKPYTAKAFPNLASVTKRNLLDTIGSLSNSMVEDLKCELKGQLVSGEIDGAKKAGKDYTSILFNGKFVETTILSFAETKPNMEKWIQAALDEKEKDYLCSIVSFSNDNCCKIDSANAYSVYEKGSFTSKMHSTLYAAQFQRYLSNQQGYK